MNPHNLVGRTPGVSTTGQFIPPYQMQPSMSHRRFKVEASDVVWLVTASVATRWQAWADGGASTEHKSKPLMSRRYWNGVPVPTTRAPSHGGVAVLLPRGAYHNGVPVPGVTGRGYKRHRMVGQGIRRYKMLCMGRGRRKMKGKGHCGCKH